ncbi:hypothetical protein BS47DRAFT_14003 [Hydnum rufescens UP504]|uniref:Uncharacterized protein n=1 Tax=Hydnum rufescens UP504 TaxID=1448309 RepID=A0A9P6E0W7_9AGAM|nr:hypothetical protein BS47DRAFT_14003 [Hydnum rufescens UP504]
MKIFRSFLASSTIFSAFSSQTVPGGETGRSASPHLNTHVEPINPRASRGGASFPLFPDALRTRKMFISCLGRMSAYCPNPQASRPGLSDFGFTPICRQNCRFVC